MRFLLAAAIWGVATCAALFLAWQTKVGPVIYKVSYRHGIHSGDVLAFLVAWMWAAYLTIGLYRSTSRRR
jgi:hypothetical protein